MPRPRRSTGESRSDTIAADELPRQAEQTERGLCVFATRIEECFDHRRGWYRSGAVAGLVREYYALLRSVVRSKPEVRPCLARCRDCRIFFVADPRNAGRHDLRCPFGCQQAHRRRESTQRSVAYYQDETGKMKKRIQNGKRGAPAAKASPATTEGPSETLVEGHA